MEGPFLGAWEQKSDRVSQVIGYHGAMTKIEMIARRTGYSEAEVEEALIHQIDLLCSEADMAYNGKPLSQVLKETRQDRKNLLAAVHFLSQSTRDIVTLAQERTNVMASAAITVTRRLGIAKALPELATDQELQEGSGYIDSVGRLIRSAVQPGGDELKPIASKDENLDPPQVPDR